jgi:hypothetical protein
MPTVRPPRECRTPRAVPAMPPGGSNRELPTNVNRVDPSGRIDRAVTEDKVPDDVHVFRRRRRQQDF